MIDSIILTIRSIANENDVQLTNFSVSYVNDAPNSIFFDLTYKGLTVASGFTFAELNGKANPLAEQNFNLKLMLAIRKLKAE